MRCIGCDKELNDNTPFIWIGTFYYCEEDRCQLEYVKHAKECGIKDILKIGE